MHSFFRQALQVLLHLGFLGPLALGIADSSFLFLPIGNDLLIVILVARHHSEFWLYTLTGAIGSTLGVLLVDLTARKLGESGIQKMAGQRRFEYLKKKVNRRGAFFVAFSALSPPPFPFTMVVATTCALGFSRKKLLGVVFVSRIVRFLIFSALAVLYGRRILRFIETPAFRYSVIALAVLCVIVSAFSIAKWARAGKAKS